MPGFLKAAAIVMSSGTMMGTGVLMVLPEDSHIPDLPVLSCQQQFWLNADRTCQTWTAPRREVSQYLAANAVSVENAPATENTTIAERTPAMTTEVAPTRAGGTAHDKARSARNPAPTATGDGARRITTRSASRDFPG
jgi:hypothetical protein